MSTSRRNVLAAGAALAAADLAPAAGGPPREIAQLTRLSEQGNAALMRGDIARYMELVKMAPDFTLMSPFGGEPSHGASYTPERMQSMGRFFRNGDLQQEVVQAWGTADMVVLAIIERALHVEVGGLPAQDWTLRVTLVYRRHGSEWHLVHRHADPLAAGISLQQAAALGRGERQEPAAAR
ncbi:YybH family protein [Ramlibacter pallidus]|uniref:Nuclear transport factor 2 family protein n=1 Tax=Ramlibacter pallidus TaxID=2780087 RepID=A0ABR9S8L8_9BURK|nr:nuclear transport factor 2 family protein [Ramlibacter pallidus]MBE7369895.1 nuclear transport factor 2 family protein [Ramlibacter pallidus]